MKIIISGGGTGGHIFPAIAIANELGKKIPGIEILFVGAKGRMEEEKVPKAGYKIESLDISGFDRGNLAKNIKLPVKIIKSLNKVKSIIKQFNPDAVIGVGGFASGPTLFMASMMNIPTFIQEQNAYPGVTNKIVGKKARKIFTAYKGLEKYFQAEKIVITGNPIRKEIIEIEGKKEQAIKYFGLNPDKKTLLIIGGSLGAKSINEAIDSGIEKLNNNDIQIIWQTGKNYSEKATSKAKEYSNISTYSFIEKMDLAYAAADIIISRAGAIAISELCCIGKPVIFVPFPYASEDHQTKNAMSLVEKNAGIHIKNEEASEKLIEEVIKLSQDTNKVKSMSENIKLLGHKNAASEIADNIISSLNGKNIKETSYKNIYFIGIGGIGMSAIARYYKSNGTNIAGYDKTPSQLTEQLINEGININFNENLNNIPSNVDLVIYTPAIKEHPAFEYFKNKGTRIIKRSEALAEITKGNYCIAVAGTHGKTTTTTMISHILKNSGKKINAFLGGISTNYNSNLILTENAEITVVEADEFDKSFLKLNPDISVITSTDADHLDIYGTKDQMVESFNQFASKTKEILVLKDGTSVTLDKKAKTILYALNKQEKTNCYAQNIKIENGKNIFDIKFDENKIPEVILGMPGTINIENALAAYIVTKNLGCTDNQIKEALTNFKGVSRRFDVRIAKNNFTYIDDYCHHPEEIKAFINSVKDFYPGKKLTGIFQPHLYSRTKDFMNQFAESLGLLDNIILLDIYPAREKPIEGITSEELLKRITVNGKKIVTEKENLLTVIEELQPEILMTMGAGDIDRLVTTIEQKFA